MSLFKSFYKKAPPAKRRTKKERWAKRFVIVLKCMLMVAAPMLVVPFVAAFWYYFIYTDGWHFSGKMENIVTTALFASQLILFGMMVTFLALDPVCREYKRIRFAVKKGDIDTFMLLRDESLSPVVHTLIFVFSVVMLGTMMAIEYPSATAGLICVCTLTYLLVLTFIVVVEIDNPCSGLWYIKDIPEEWLKKDVEEYRREHCTWKPHRNGHRSSGDED